MLVVDPQRLLLVADGPFGVRRVADDEPIRAAAAELEAAARWPPYPVMPA
jgi:hypothetical protein